MGAQRTVRIDNAAEDGSLHAVVLVEISCQYRNLGHENGCQSPRSAVERTQLQVFPISAAFDGRLPWENLENRNWKGVSELETLQEAEVESG